MDAHFFINYRREDSAAYAGRLYDRLSDHFGKEKIFMDIDTIGLGEDFAEVLQQKVGQCQALITIIGEKWLHIRDNAGIRRLDNPNDFVRMEIVNALKREIRVIPVLVGNAIIPAPDDLPEDLAPLSRRNALEISDKRFHHDMDVLIQSLEKLTVSPEEPQEVTIKTTQDVSTTTETKKVDYADVKSDFSPPISMIRRLFLFYKPKPGRSWTSRIVFYLLLFFLGPFFCFLAFGAYIGPDRTLAGFSVPIFFLVVALVLRYVAIRADRRA